LGAESVAAGSDAVTRGWRGISLRAKVTGVTVGILAIGLLVAGVGTLIFLRGSLLDGISSSLLPLARTNVTSPLVSVSDTNPPTFSHNPDAVATEYFVALYNAQGKLEITAGGNGAPPPVLPET
jgi:two-component system OmpR family sensor kinase